MDNLSFKTWLTENMAAPITSAGAAGANAEKAIEDAIKQAPEGEKVGAAKQALDKLTAQKRGQQTSVKDAITLAAAQDKIAKEAGPMMMKKK